MSAIHVASAANEVAQALPSTATVTVSKHGIQAIETLNLEAQTSSQSQLTWSRTFSGMEILTNPALHYTAVTTPADLVAGTSDVVGDLEDFKRWKQHVRLASDPIGTAASSINLTVNNASMSITPNREHRIVTSVFPDEPNPAHQRKHYGLNQLDEFAEPAARVFQAAPRDDVERMHNANALRETYPCRHFCETTVGGSTKYRPVGEQDFDALIVTVTLSHATTASLKYDVKKGNQIIGYAYADAFVANTPKQMLVVSSTPTPSSGNYGTIDIADAVKFDGSQIGALSLVLSAGQNLPDDQSIRQQFSSFHMGPGASLGLVMGGTEGSKVTVPNLLKWKVLHDVYQPLNHPYFRDNYMRDNTLVNVRYFDCQITLKPNDLTEVGQLNLGVRTNKAVAYTTELLLGDGKIGDFTLGIKPTLIFDLITPSVPLPTISDKVIKTYHTITSSSTSLDGGTKPKVGLQSGNIQLAQVPDKIYVFIRSSFDLNSTLAKPQRCPTRCGVITNLRVRTPQNSAFLINMDQESLYQMSCRNGSKQSRSSFMCSLGSVVAIDPERDLGGYTNGVLVPFTFEVVADFSLPYRSNSLGSTVTESIVQSRDLCSQVLCKDSDLLNTTGEQWTMHVVCELGGHLYLMSDGTGKQTKSNLTVTEVADAVADGIHHPSTFPEGRVNKMDSGVLGEIAKMGPGEVGDDTRAAMRA